MGRMINALANYNTKMDIIRNSTLSYDLKKVFADMATEEFFVSTNNI